MTPNPEATTVRRLYWSAFALRCGVALLAWVLTEYFHLPFMEDAKTYSQTAAGVAQSWLKGEESPWLNQAIDEGRHAWFMVVTLAVVYCATAGNEVLPVAIVCYCLLTSFTPVLAYRASRQLGVPSRGALSGARLVAYSPAFAFWTSALYKEGLILIALYLIIDHLLQLQQDVKPRSLLILAVCLLALFGLRFYIAAILVVALGVGLVFGRRHRRGFGGDVPIVRQVVVLFLLFFVLSLFGIKDQADNVLSVGVEQGLEQINNSRRDLASYRSGYLRTVDVSNVDQAVAFLPAGIAYFLAVPLPWHFGSYRQNLAIPETLFWIVVVYPRVLRGMRRGASLNPQGTLFLIVASVAICCLYALYIGNIGTAYRVRIQVWAIWALFAGLGWRPLPAGEAIPTRQPALSAPRQA